MSAFRIGIFERDTAAGEGGADTLLRLLQENVSAGIADRGIEIVRVPALEWDFRRRPLRRFASRAARLLGVHFPYVDLRPDCRRHRLDAAYFPAPVFAAIDLPFVFTVWDLAHRTLPQFREFTHGSDGAAQREAMYRTMLARAATVVTGNAAGAAEIQRFYAVPPARIAIVPFPNPAFRDVAAQLPAGAPTGPFFFYPAQFWAHKNHVTLLRALAQLPQGRGPAASLVFTGSDKGHEPDVRSAVRELGLEGRVHFAGFVTRAALKAYYERAVALTFPSRLGPNNLPPQEAAVLGCPVVLSDLPGHREQLGDGALYCGPDDPAGWAAAMQRLIEHPAERAERAARARAAVAACTVENYAARLGAVFARLAVAGGRA